MPPVALALAVKANIKVNVSTTIPHHKLGSKTKTFQHGRKIAETIIGDCLEAICVFRGEKRNRIYNGYKYEGYNNERKIDILEEYISKID